MKISTKGRYGARAMVELALVYEKRLLRANEIAERQDISLKYLEALLARLKSAGLLICERGPKGGYALTRPPEEISMYDVLCPLEDSLDVVHCTKDPARCQRLETCVTRGLWVQLRTAAERILRETTLRDMAERQQSIEDEKASDELRVT